MPRSPARLGFALSLTALTFACGGGDLTLPNEGEPAALEVLDGDDQDGTVGEPLGKPLVVRVTDRFGDPVPEVVVQWSAQNGGGVDPVESTTDAQGRASTQRTLGAEPATYVTLATVDGVDDPATFTSTGFTARLVITSRLQAIATSGVPLDPQPTLQLQDAEGNPISSEGVTVAVVISSGGGELEGSTTATSNAAGEVAFTDLAISGDPGSRTLVFRADGFTEVNSTTIDVQPPPPAGTTTTITSADPNPSPAGTPVTVQFTVTSPGGTPTGSVTVSDGTVNCTGDLSNGAGNCALTLATPGDLTLTATYQPSGGGFAASSGTLPHHVDAPTSGLRAPAGT